MPKYKPMLIGTDSEGYDVAIMQAEDKCATFTSAVKWASQYVDINDFEAFSESFTAYFKEIFYAKYKGRIDLNISVEKLLSLMDIELGLLTSLEEDFRSNKSVVSIDDGRIVPVVNKADFETYTRSSEENEKLRDSRSFIEALNRLGKHTTISPLNIQRATSNLISYNINRGEYSVILR